MAEIDVEIDGITESVIEERSAKVLSTRIVSFHEMTEMQQSRTTPWRFPWSEEELGAGRIVVGLIVERSENIEGCMSFEFADDHVFVHLIESAPHNVGENKVFRGVPGNLFAFACLRSFELGYGGFVAFDAKTELIIHYHHSLGARQVGASSRMIIDAENARQLITKYFKETDQWPS